jgi:hypothetical protein
MALLLMQQNVVEQQQEEEETAHTILRFNFSETIMTRIAYFAKLHQFEDRQTYKTNWTRWYEENHTCLDAEIQRLDLNGYEGDGKEKMYKAGRYYFRKKAEDKKAEDKKTEDKKAEDKKAEDNTTEKDKKKAKEPSKKYTMMDKAILAVMDTHIRTSRQNNKAYTPAKGYTEFCERFAPLLVIETARLKLVEQIDEEHISNKIKKTYKNRYFIITR